MQVGKMSLEDRQQRSGQLRPCREGVGRSEDQRGVHRRRLSQQARRRARRGHRQVEALLGRVRQQAGRRGSRQVRPGRAAAEAVPQPGALRRAQQRRAGLRLRPAGRPHPGLQCRRHVREGSALRQDHAGLGLRLGPRVLAAIRSRGTSSSPTARTNVVRVIVRDTLQEVTNFGDGGRQPGSSTACTASRPTPRATSTRPKRSKASACRGSSSRGWGKCRRARVCLGHVAEPNGAWLPARQEDFQKRHAKQAPKSSRLQHAVIENNNVFEVLMDAVRVLLARADHECAV